MTFYGIDYLQNNAGVNDYIKYGLIFAALIFLIFVFSTYLRHRLDTKYRDLTIIFLLLLLFLLGVQYSDYKQDQSNHSQSSQMVHFVKRVAQDEVVTPEEVYVNSTTLTDQMLVLIVDDCYRVTLSQDGTNFKMDAVALLTAKDQIVKQK